MHSCSRNRRSTLSGNRRQKRDEKHLKKIRFRQEVFLKKFKKFFQTPKTESLAKNFTLPRPRRDLPAVDSSKKERQS